MGNKSSKSKNRRSTESTTTMENEEEINEILTNTTEESKNLKEFRDYFNSEDNDYKEHDHHFLKKHLFQCTFSSPIKEELTNSGKVLDLGCGNGTFLLDVATNYPNSECVGLDIEPVFPSEIKPKNLRFEIADIFQRLPFSDNEFDLVHLESMLFTTTSTQLNPLIDEMLRVTKPNGYIEFAEINKSLYKEFEKFGQLISGYSLLAASHGVEAGMVLKLPEILTTKPNVTDINVKDKTIIIGKNGGKLGILIMQILFEWFSSNKSISEVSKHLNITNEQYNQLVKDSLDELDHVSPEITFYRVYTQKRC